jgi:hypothetical protein
MVFQVGLAEKGQCREDLIRNGRKTYESGGDAESIKERYIRVAAIIVATIAGIKNNCIKRHVRNQSLAPSVAHTRKDLPGCMRLIFRAEPSSINMLQCETGNETYRSHSNKGATTV